jgi:hypothetical protein
LVENFLVVYLCVCVLAISNRCSKDSSCAHKGLMANWPHHNIFGGLAVLSFYSWLLVTAPFRPEKDDSPKYSNRSGAPSVPVEEGLYWLLSSLLVTSRCYIWLNAAVVARRDSGRTKQAQKVSIACAGGYEHWNCYLTLGLHWDCLGCGRRLQVRGRDLIEKT